MGQTGMLEGLADVRFGSKADVRTAKRDVRFAPDGGHVQRVSPCPLSANSGRTGHSEGTLICAFSFPSVYAA